jgi:hypothetical protein
MRDGYEPLTARRRWVVVMLGAIVTASLVAVWFWLSELNMIDPIESGALVGDDEMAANDNRVRAIGAWFVPILNFWRPKQIVNDV